MKNTKFMELLKAFVAETTTKLPTGAPHDDLREFLSSTAQKNKKRLSELRAKVQGPLPMNGADFSSSVLCGVDLTRADLKAATFAGSIIESCKFDNANLTDASFERAVITGGSFTDAIMKSTTFDDASLAIVALHATCLREAQFHRTYFLFVDIAADADFDSASFADCCWARHAYCRFGKDGMLSRLRARLTPEQNSQLKRESLLQLFFGGGDALKQGLSLFTPGRRHTTSQTPSTWGVWIKDSEKAHDQYLITALMMKEADTLPTELREHLQGKRKGALAFQVLPDEEKGGFNVLVSFRAEQ